MISNSTDANLFEYLGNLYSYQGALSFNPLEFGIETERISPNRLGYQAVFKIYFNSLILDSLKVAYFKTRIEEDGIETSFPPPLGKSIAYDYDNFKTEGFTHDYSYIDLEYQFTGDITISRRVDTIQGKKADELIAIDEQYTLKFEFGNSIYESESIYVSNVIYRTLNNTKKRK